MPPTVPPHFFRIRRCFQPQPKFLQFWLPISRSRFFAVCYSLFFSPMTPQMRWVPARRARFRFFATPPEVHRFHPTGTPFPVYFSDGFFPSKCLSGHRMIGLSPKPFLSPSSGFHTTPEPPPPPPLALRAPPLFLHLPTRTHRIFIMKFPGHPPSFFFSEEYVFVFCGIADFFPPLKAYLLSVLVALCALRYFFFPPRCFCAPRIFFAPDI